MVIDSQEHLPKPFDLSVKKEAELKVERTLSSLRSIKKENRLIGGEGEQRGETHILGSNRLE